MLARRSSLADRGRRSLALVALALPSLALPSVARAQPSAAATLAADVDGDGRADALRIEAPGQLVLERAAGGGQVILFGLSGALAEGRLEVAPTPAGPVLTAVARIGPSWEGVALRWEKGRLRELWRGAVGPADDDEYALWIGARTEGVIRYQERADLVRCDPQPIELFRELWDDRAGGFKPRPGGVRIPDTLPVVSASAAGVAAAAGWYRPVATSSMAGATDAAQLVAPRALADDDLATAWTSARADGVGAAITFRSTLRGGKAASLRIVPGGRDARAARAHLRPARLAVLGAGGGALVDVPDPAAGKAPDQVYAARLPVALDGCVTVVVVAVHRAGAAADAPVAIPELAIISDIEEGPGGLEPALAAMVADGGLAGESAGRALAARGPPAVKALTARLATASATERARVLTALAAVADPAVLPLIADALVTGELSLVAVEPSLGALLALEPAAGEGELSLLLRTGARGGRRLDDRVRLALARAAARRWQPTTGVDAGHGLALLDAAGQGSPELRAELATLLAAAGAPALLAAVERGRDRAPAWQADVWRAAGKAALAAAPEVQRAAVVALADALDAAPDHERRYRLMVALAPLVDGDAALRLGRWLTAHAATASDRGLRRLAAAGLARNRHADARLLLIELVADGDPGTRLAALRGLGSADEPVDLPSPRPAVTADPTLVRDSGDRALVTALTGDRWPELRREAAAALGPRCTRLGPRTALEQAVDAEPDLPVRLEALAALVTCRAPGIELRLLAVADDRRAPSDLRDRAIALYGALPGDALLLLPRFERLRGQAFSDDLALRLAARAATALGAIGDPRAGHALVTAARDGTFPELAAAAATALGALGAGCPADAPAVLRALLGHDDRRVALAARGALQRCGRAK